MDRSTKCPVVSAALDDLERACQAIEQLRGWAAGPGSDTSFELGEASQAAHRALLVLRGWDRATSPDLAPLALSAQLC